MKLTVRETAMVKTIAKRMIGSYILAVEQGDINDFDNWIHEPDHWLFDKQDGEMLLRLLGYSEKQIERAVKDVRKSMEE